MAEEMFDGFDHTVYRAEVEEKWGADAYRQGSDWFAAMTTGERAEWMQRQKQLATDWAAAAERGVDAKSPEARALVERHVAWLASIPGTPSGPEYVRALGDLYVEDPRFAANYGGADGARFVRDALHEHVN